MALIIILAFLIELNFPIPCCENETIKEAFIYVLADLGLKRDTQECSNTFSFHSFSPNIALASALRGDLRAGFIILIIFDLLRNWNP